MAAAKLHHTPATLLSLLLPTAHCTPHTTHHTPHHPPSTAPGLGGDATPNAPNPAMTRSSSSYLASSIPPARASVVLACFGRTRASGAKRSVAVHTAHQTSAYPPPNPPRILLDFTFSRRSPCLRRRQPASFPPIHPSYQAAPPSPWRQCPHQHRWTAPWTS